MIYPSRVLVLARPDDPLCAPFERAARARGFTPDPRTPEEVFDRGQFRWDLQSPDDFAGVLLLQSPFLGPPEAGTYEQRERASLWSGWVATARGVVINRVPPALWGRQWIDGADLRVVLRPEPPLFVPEMCISTCAGSLAQAVERFGGRAWVRPFGSTSRRVLTAETLAAAAPLYEHAPLAVFPWHEEEFVYEVIGATVTSSDTEAPMFAPLLDAIRGVARALGVVWIRLHMTRAGDRCVCVGVDLRPACHPREEQDPVAERLAAAVDGGRP